MPLLLPGLLKAMAGPDTNAPWPLFMQNPRHTGWTQKSVLGAQKNPVLKWSFSTGNAIFGSPCLDAGGTVYTASGSTLYALTNGAVKWSCGVGWQGSSSPSLDRSGRVFIGSDNLRLYAVTNAGVKWIYLSADDIGSSPAVSQDGTIYITDRDGILTAVTNGAAKWSYNTGNQSYSTPSLGADGTVYMANNGARVYAITNGAVKWQFLMSQGSDSSVAIGADGTCYAGDFNGNFYAVTNGVQKWVLGGLGAILSSSAAIGPDGVIYLGGGNGRVYAITNGAVKWSYDTGTADIRSSPAIGSDGTIYIGHYNTGKIYAVTNGALKWSYQTGGMLFSTPAIGPDGTIYAGCTDGALYAIKQDEVPLLSWSGSPGFQNDGVHPGTNAPGGLFTFRVVYRDAENTLPLTNEVWIDLDDSGTYEGNERFPMTASDTNDTNCGNGKEYFYTNRPAEKGDGLLAYRFFFTDNLYRAAGSPCQDHYLFAGIPEETGAPAGALDKVTVAPNPWKPRAGQDHITFYNLTPEFEIIIYSISGLEITRVNGTTRNGRYRWECTDRQGEPLKPGVYLCAVKNSRGEKKELRIVISR